MHTLHTFERTMNDVIKHVKNQQNTFSSQLALYLCAQNAVLRPSEPRGHCAPAHRRADLRAPRLAAPCGRPGSPNARLELRWVPEVRIHPEQLADKLTIVNDVR